MEIEIKTIKLTKLQKGFTLMGAAFLICLIFMAIDIGIKAALVFLGICIAVLLFMLGLYWVIDA
jgi:hypothetical protein